MIPARVAVAKNIKNAAAWASSLTMPTLFSHFQDVEAHLARVGLFHQDLRLGRMERALTALGLSDSSRLPL